MARKTMWAVAGALLAFAQIASAANYSLGLNNPRIYASEVITGADVELDYDGDVPEVNTSINFGTGSDATTEVEAIDQGDVLEVTITLHNAKFGENVKSSDMSPLFSGVSGCNARVKDVEGGSQGDSTVTFEVEAAGGNCALGTAPHFIRMPFELPTLEGLNARRPVTATVSTAAGGGSGWRGTSHSTAASGVACGTDISMARTTCVRLEDGVLTRLAPAAATRPQGAAPLISYVAGLTFEPSNGAVVGGNRVAAASIDLAAGRSNFVDEASAPLAQVQVGVASAAACTTDDPMIPAACVRQTDGEEFSIGRGGEGQGDLKVVVTGDFREGDTVWLEHDGESGAGGRETLDMQDDGSMMGTFALNDVAGNAQAAAGDSGDMDREEGVATRVLYYAPNGDDGLRPATFRTSFSVDFDSSAVADKPWARGTPSEFATSFTVVEDTQHAYAIPELGATDEGNVRIKCEVATECTVYLECDDTVGNSRFAQLDDPIAGRSTTTLNAAAIAAALDFGDDGWEGSLSCTVYSTREITVQVLVRSADVLVNQTYIEND